DTDPVLPEVTRHPAGRAVLRGFGGRVGGKAAGGAPQGVAAEVDDRSATGGDHAGSDGLDREEHVPQVRRDAFVVILWRDVLPPMAVVARGVIDEYTCRAVGRRERRDRASERVDVPQIARF